MLSVFPGPTLTAIWPAHTLEKHSARMMPAAEVGKAIVHAIDTPHGVMIEDLYLQPLGGPL